MRRTVIKLYLCRIGFRRFPEFEVPRGAETQKVGGWRGIKNNNVHRLCILIWPRLTLLVKKVQEKHIITTTEKNAARRHIPEKEKNRAKRIETAAEEEVGQVISKQIDVELDGWKPLAEVVIW